MPFLVEGALSSGRIIYLQFYVDCEDDKERPSFVFDALGADRFDTRDEAEAALYAWRLDEDGFAVQEHEFVEVSQISDKEDLP